MSAITWTGVVVATALWMWPGPGWRLQRVVPDTGTPHIGPARTADAPDDPFAVAAAFDLFAVCLRAGLPTGTAAEVVAGVAPPRLAEPLSRTAELLHLGADPEIAWSPSVADRAVEVDRPDSPHEALAMIARRSARAGSSMAAGLVELAVTTRESAHDDALAAAERAGVTISGPLGLCFLPAFVCLGIAPVVIGLAGSVLGEI